MPVPNFLDPRYKLAATSFYLNEIYVEYSEVVDEIIKDIKKLYNEYVSDASYVSFRKAQAQASQSVSISMPQGVGSGFEKKKSWFAQFINSMDDKPLKTDLDIYMEETHVRWNENMNGNFDILGWWKVKAEKYPIEVRMAHEYWEF